MWQSGKSWQIKMNRYLKEKKEVFIEKRIGNTLIVAVNPLPEEVQIDSVIKKVKNLIPEHFLNNIDTIYIGQFEMLKDRDLTAMYSDGAIYISNEQYSSSGMAEEIIHEISHSLEETESASIYADGRLESEFLAKRRNLYFILKQEGYPVELGHFLELDYSRDFDEFLYEVIGYPLMSTLTVNLFYSPYGATSLREYFANGFEAYYYHRDISYLKKVSPILFDKVKKLGYNKE
jgi:hypothetical protein